MGSDLQVRRSAPPGREAVAEVAAAMGVDDAVVYRFEKGGTNSTLSTVRRYALAVGAMLELGASSASDHGKPVSNHVSKAQATCSSATPTIAV